MAIEPALLHIERRTIPVAVEAGFTYCNHAWTSDELLEIEFQSSSDRVRGVIGMDSDSREDTRPGRGPSWPRLELSAAVVPMAITCETPAALARDSTSANWLWRRRSARWAWVSTHVAFL